MCVCVCVCVCVCGERESGVCGWVDGTHFLNIISSSNVAYQLIAVPQFAWNIHLIKEVKMLDFMTFNPHSKVL